MSTIPRERGASLSAGEVQGRCPVTVFTCPALLTKRGMAARYRGRVLRTPAGAVDDKRCKSTRNMYDLTVHLSVVVRRCSFLDLRAQTPRPRLVEANAASSCQAMAHADSLSRLSMCPCPRSSCEDELPRPSAAPSHTPPGHQSTAAMAN